MTLSIPALLAILFSGALLFLQLVASGPVLQFLLRLRFHRTFALRFRGPGLIVPLLRFTAYDFRVMVPGGPEHDRVYFESRRLSFRLDPVLLLIGRVRLIHLELHEPYLEYTNRMESRHKNRYLPARHRFELKRARIHNGRVSVRDETMTPVYRLEMARIEVENMDLDVGTPIDFLFRTERGEATLASGRLEIGTTRDTGFIRLRDVTWGEIASMERLPFMSGRLALAVTHTGGAAGRHVQGQLGSQLQPPDQLLHSDNQSTGTVAFQFDIDWNDYRVTLDLGLQKLIDNILKNASSDLIGQGIVLGGRGVFGILKKPEE